MLSKKIFLVFIFAVCNAAHATLPIQHWTLENGARVYFVENRELPMLDISVEFDAGDRRDPEGKSGMASLTNAMLARGISEGRLPDGQVEPAMTEAQISDAFADIAARRGGGAGEDRAGATLRTLSSKQERDAAVALLGRLLAQPSFPEDLLVRDKARTIAAIKEDLTKPESIASKAFWRIAYGSHPYADEATVESVEAISREDLVAFHSTHYVANRAVIAMIGNVSRAEADAIARQLSRRLPQGKDLPALPEVVLANGREEWIAHPASQSHILVGTPALVRGDPDFFALTVGNYVLGGGGFVSRLTREVREKRGLAYSVYSYFNPLQQRGPFQIGLQTQKEQTAEALAIVRKVVADYLAEGPSDKDLQAAKDNLIGGFPLRIDNNRKILDNIAAIGYYNLPLNYLDTWTANVAKVTVSDVKAAFKRKLALERFNTVVVGAQQ
ncbi:pitrilysin family protein [Oxalobacteraceae bacterium R-40]|uniref:Pitrilysin family protein n=1 Tax=Keguizhuia sedimenti TaxID=3064264 RepID=A0ABU1BJ36_9BURK|nr:pitrilysin family protein [Oxalobacteraceae bacterium R-40]